MRPLRVKRIAGIVLPLCVSAGLVAWVLADLERPEEVIIHFWRGDSLFIALSIVTALLSFLIRANRWRRFIGRPVPFFHVFSSLMIGTAVNGIVPRGGELVRVVNLNRISKLPIAQLLTTVVVERVLDVIALLALIGLSISIEGERVRASFPMLTASVPLILGLAAVLSFILVGLALFSAQTVRVVGGMSDWMHPRMGHWVRRILEQCVSGLKFVRDTRQHVGVAVDTLGTWICQWLSFAFGLIAFELYNGVGLLGSMAAFSITGASVFVPSAGAIGAFHKLCQESLTLLYDREPAAVLAFATVLHLILYYIVPFAVGISVWTVQMMLVRRQTNLIHH